MIRTTERIVLGACLGAVGILVLVSVHPLATFAWRVLAPVL